MSTAGNYERLLTIVERSGSRSERNAVAFSGGTDSSLVAHAVHSVFPNRSLAVLGVSPSLSREQNERAHRIAKHVGIPLRTVTTDEGNAAEYVANRGMSCYHCKTSLYTLMGTLLRTVAADGNAVLFNGTNADDLRDETRVGLIAAREHRVASPLKDFTKAQVRVMARHTGLPNWNTAASPCLRSRLQFGIEATTLNLSRIEQAEMIVREMLDLPESANFRVRHTPGAEAVIELDPAFLPDLDLDACAHTLLSLGFASVRTQAYKSGNVARLRLPVLDSP